MATSSETTTEGVVWSMGLKGLVGHIANLSAVTLVCVMFYQSVAGQQVLAREDRQAYRDELRTMHMDADRLWQAVSKLQTSQEETARALKENQAATQQVLQAMQSLAAEIRDLKATKPTSPKPQE